MFKALRLFFTGEAMAVVSLVAGQSVELFFFGRAGQGGDRGRATLNHGGHVIEVTGAYFLLVCNEGVTLGGVSKLLFLQRSRAPG